MPQTMTNTDALTQVNSVHATSRGPLTHVNSDAEVLRIIRRVLAEQELKHEAAARSAGVKPSQFSLALNGTGNFGVTWVYAQSDAFLLRFVELLMETRGLTPENARAVRACRIVELVKLLTEDA